MSIQPLPGDVVAQIKSSIIITSLNSVVSGLLQNSLDAHASKINVSVDYSRGNCSVEDDGLGILPSSFHENGGVGELHYTSKYPPRPDYHGRRGEFLASLGTLSLLTVASHHHEYRSHSCLTIHNSKVIARNIPALPEQRVVSFRNGTRITVRDLFGSMPVRVKQRATEVDRLGSAKSFDQLVFTCVAFLLAWPTGITLSLRDTLANRSIVLRTSTLSTGSHNRKEIAREVPPRTCSLLGQASLLEREDAKSWVSIGVSISGVSLSGCVCLVPVATKRVQFVALGIQPLLNENQSNVLYEEVNKVFANSSFGVVEEVEVDEDGVPKKTDGFTAKELKPKRGIDRWPMFFIQITLEDHMDSLSTDELIDDTHHNLNMITDLLQVMVYEFLRKHHFHPRAVNAVDRFKQPKAISSKGVRARSNTPTAAISRNRSHQSSSRSSTRVKSRKLRPSGGSEPPRASRDSASPPFASWARVKSGSKSTPTGKSSSPTVNSTRTGEQALGDTNRDHHQSRASRPMNPLFDKSGNLLRKPFDDVDDVDDGNANEDPDEATEPIVWIDPATKIRSLIDPRTGFKVKPNKTTGLPELDKSKTNAVLAASLKDSLPRNLPAGKEVTVFKPTEPVIPRVPEVPDSFGQGRGKCSHNSGDLGNVHLDLPNGVGASTTISGRLSKDALRNAEILGQVDKKFILAKLSTAEDATERSLLVIIDQHAADERCRVEDLMRSYFQFSGGKTKAQSQAVSKPLRFDLSQQEGKLLTRYQNHFRHWGVRYEVFAQEDNEKVQKSSVSGTIRVEVQSLPPSIIERCRVEPRLLIDLVRKEIWNLHDNPGIPVSGNIEPIESPALDDEGGLGWFSRFHHCPEGILEMINSRSCRSAIMFNDPLTKDQCIELVQRLTRCAFPFQCAHGRPSMVPIVDIGSSTGNASLGGLFKREKDDEKPGNASLGGLFKREKDDEKPGDLMRALKKWANVRRAGSE